ncbi:uncharacterized protein LOC131212040 [Anopheles bellator]|uniref:uncharacterized protein LOC131212040 n=1 Tax=Anopheles bellator TaxID=139047 RepID=UPI00264A49BA|nr:uncharacterized protein LOC131212040 [Anopheles bellator]
MVSTVVRSSLVVLLLVIGAIYAAPPQKPYEKLSALKARSEQQAVDRNDSSEASGSSAEQDSEETLEKIQAKSAQYSYDSSVNDTINDHTIQRQEERNGLSLKGMYSYSDGFFKRTVHYEADDKGYRVVKEINIPIGNGPQVNPKGKADVSSSLAGSYSITAYDIAKPQRKQAVVAPADADSNESGADDKQSA